MWERRWVNISDWLKLEKHSVGWMIKKNGWQNYLGSHKKKSRLCFEGDSARLQPCPAPPRQPTPAPPRQPWVVVLLPGAVWLLADKMKLLLALINEWSRSSLESAFDRHNKQYELFGKRDLNLYNTALGLSVVALSFIFPPGNSRKRQVIM